MKTKNLLLIIDMQNDFCRPDGSLYVKGAEKDVKRLSDFISVNRSYIDHIILTLDNHHIIDISHPAFWEDKKGNNPEPYTPVTLDEIKQGKWVPRFYPDKARDYIEKLNEQGEFIHVIWPEHCIIGSSGAAIPDELLAAVSNWARKGRFYDVVRKGLNPLTEHFGALWANVPSVEDGQTLPNKSLIQKLSKFGQIIIAGEAKSHCVASTINQILETNGINGRMIILEDAMSDVTGFEDLATPIYNKAISKGALLTTTDKLKLYS